MSRRRKIFVLGDSNVITGGPEAVHHLTHLLHRLGEDAYVVYSPDPEAPVPAPYARFRVKVARKVEDKPGNLVIAAESSPERLNKVRHAARAIWWLSVDNAPFQPPLASLARRGAYHFLFRKGINRSERLKRAFSGIDRAFFTMPSERKRGLIANYVFRSGAVRDPYGIIHLAQSGYAMDFLRRYCGARARYLREPINARFLKSPAKLSGKKDIVIYFPKKGAEATAKLVRAAPELNWTPIKGLSDAQMLSLFRSAKVYVDFGPHPGRDRIPRETAACGCCVIVGKNGSAAYHQDIPVPAGYKFPADPLEPRKVAAAIRGCIAGYSARIRDFAEYRRSIRAAPRQFASDARSLLSELP